MKIRCIFTNEREGVDVTRTITKKNHRKLLKMALSADYWEERMLLHGGVKLWQTK